MLLWFSPVVLLVLTCLIFAVRLGLVTWRHWKRPLETSESRGLSGIVAWDLWHTVADTWKGEKRIGHELVLPSCSNFLVLFSLILHFKCRCLVSANVLLLILSDQLLTTLAWIPLVLPWKSSGKGPEQPRAPLWRLGCGSLLLAVQGGVPTGTQQACTHSCSCSFLGSSLWSADLSGLSLGFQEVCHSLGHRCWASSSPGAVSRSPAGSHSSFPCFSSAWQEQILQFDIDLCSVSSDVWYSRGQGEWLKTFDTNVLPFPELCTAWAGWISLTGEGLWLLWEEVKCTDELVPDLG